MDMKMVGSRNLLDGQKVTLTMTKILWTKMCTKSLIKLCYKMWKEKEPYF